MINDIFSWAEQNLFHNELVEKKLVMWSDRSGESGPGKDGLMLAETDVSKA